MTDEPGFGPFSSWDSGPYLCEFIVIYIGNLSSQPMVDGAAVQEDFEDDADDAFQYSTSSHSSSCLMQDFNSSSSRRHSSDRTCPAPSRSHPYSSTSSSSSGILGNSLRSSSSTSPSQRSSQYQSEDVHAGPYVGGQSFPYAGDYRGTIWNSQALFASKVSRHAAKKSYILKSLLAKDFMLVCETHSTVGRAAAFNELLSSKGFRGFWSHGSTRRAGVGVIISHRFLEKKSLSPPSWIEVVPGEVACLRLQGEHGCLDLYSVYFPTGMAGIGEESNFDKRCACRTRLANHLRAPEQVLSIVGGDFNYVTKPE